MKKLEILEIKAQLKEENHKLGKILANNNIINLRMTSACNSLGSGYSMQRITLPLLKRNESLESTMLEYGINSQIKHYARMQNNCDEHFYSWMVTNKKESEIYKMNLVDYGSTIVAQQNYGLTEELKDKYYPTNIEEDKGLHDYLFEVEPNLANILVYNGCTGSFLDGITRNGKLSQKITYGIRRDIISIEATLKYIQEMNREKKTNVQVYLCGIPNYLGLNVTEIFNCRLKNIAKKYANVVYVEPIVAKFFYSNYKKDKEELSLGKKILSYRPDVHLNELEYLKLNQQIIKTIMNRYAVTQALIKLDRELLNYGRYIELENPNLIKMSEDLQMKIAYYLTNVEFKTEMEREYFQKRLEEYLLERLPYDFYYLGKKNLMYVLKKTKKNKS